MIKERRLQYCLSHSKQALVIAGLLFFFFQPAMAQHRLGSIKGKIMGADGKPAAGVSVTLQKLNKTTATNEAGFFILSHLPSIQDTLLISSIEMKPLLQAVALSENKTTDIGTVRLAYNINQLENVEIKGRLSKSYKSEYSFFGNKTETPSLTIPQSISSVTKELIQDKMELTLKDAVTEVAGVNQYSGYDEYTIRGFRAENARDINGLRGYNTTYTSSMLVNIERIEVIKGPTATLYGNCDPGGTINLVTKKPLDKKEAYLNVYAGSWNHYRAECDVTGPLNKKKTFLYRLNAGYDNTGSFRNNVTAKSYEIAPSLSFIPNDKLKMNLDVSLSHINTVLDRGQPGYEDDASLKATPISLSLVQKDDYLHETDVASTLTLSYKFNSHLSFNSGYLHYYTKQNVAEHGLHEYIIPDSVNLYYTRWNFSTHTHTMTNYFTYKTNTGNISHELLLGYDDIKSKTELKQEFYEQPGRFGEGSGIAGTFSLKNPVYTPQPIATYRLSNYDEDATDVDAEAYHTQGVYLQDQVSIDKWKLLVSIREEFYRGGGDDDDNSAESLTERVFLPRVGIVYSLKPNISLYATYNKGFDPFEATNATQVFDAAFKPITSELLEAGVKGNFFRNNLSASVALYQLSLKNVAVNANNISNPNLFVQQGENRSRGIETEATGNLLPNVSVYLTYTYSECKVIKSKIAEQVGRLTENAPRNTSGSYIKYTFAKGFLKGFGLSAGHSSVSARNTLDPAVTLPSYVIFNAGAHSTFGHFKVAVMWENFTHTTYWTGAYNNAYKWPGKPSNVMVNIAYRW